MANFAGPAHRRDNRMMTSLPPCHEVLLLGGCGKTRLVRHRPSRPDVLRARWRRRRTTFGNAAVGRGRSRSRHARASERSGEAHEAKDPPPPRPSSKRRRPSWEPRYSEQRDEDELCRVAAQAVAAAAGISSASQAEDSFGGGKAPTTHQPLREVTNSQYRSTFSASFVRGGGGGRRPGEVGSRSSCASSSHSTRGERRRRRGG